LAISAIGSGAWTSWIELSAVFFAKKALTFLGIISRSEERARAPEPEQPQHLE
jgi:hypothetical protein